jgi:sulfur-carrier protein adenylyltransferase/sulfurtransferase
LEGFGESAQEKLAKARVLVIGAGGLGCPILQYLAAAGVGTIGIADDDTVSYSNLNRQTLYGQNDIGRYKVDVAVERLTALNNEIVLVAYKQRWNQSLSIEYFPQYDIIVDATDNFASRYLINDGCVLMGKPLVFGAVSTFEGQVAIFNVANQPAVISYRDLFPDPPKNNEVLSCSEAGVLGVVPGIIGNMQALEVIKLITGIGNPLIHQLCHYNALKQETYTLQLSQNMQAIAKIPQSLEAYLSTDYEWLCAAEAVNEISIEDWLANKEKLLLVDIRELTEKPRLTQFNHLSIPLSQLNKEQAQLRNKSVVFLCQSGTRSKKAVTNFASSTREAFSLSGGVNELLKRKLI